MADYTEKMDKAIEATEREFSKIRAGQASPAILNDVRIDYYGTPTPISQVAKISVPEPRMLLVTPWEKQLVDTIDKAILAANIGVTLPILTSERRQELAKVARKHAEEGRVAIRNIRRDANDAIKKNKDLPEDEVKKQQDEIQKATDKYIAKIDALLAEKEADLLKV